MLFSLFDRYISYSRYMGDSYNRQLVRERERHGFSLREAAKAIGVSALSLFLYENGYYRPTKKHLAKIESVYGPIDFSNEKEYPLETPVFLHERPRFKKKRHIISGILAAVSLGLSITGAVMFRHSATDGEAGYGQVYLQARDAAVDEGWTGRDIASDLEYSYLYQNGDLGRGDILFYQTNSLLYFNNATYSSNMTSLKYPEIGQGRFHYQFGGDIGRSSYLCTFSYKSSSAGIFFSFDTLYGNKPIEKAQNLNIVSKGSVPITEQMAVDLFNLKIGDAMKLFDTILSEALNSEVGFYRDFLPAREEGRVVHFRMQVTGLCLLFPSLLIFFVSAAFLAFSAVRILRPRKRETEKPSEDCGENHCRRTGISVSARRITSPFGSRLSSVSVRLPCSHSVRLAACSSTFRPYSPTPSSWRSSKSVSPAASCFVRWWSSLPSNGNVPSYTKP